MLKGTKFQVIVWKYLKTIPKGQTRTYEDFAKALKGHYPIELWPMRLPKALFALIPCHRLLSLTALLEDILEKVVSKQRLNC